jgi:hypothetical protein
MKISIEKLGVFEKTELDIGDLTILCGENNTGKTYITYAIYGFLVFWQRIFEYPVEEKWLIDLKKEGECNIAESTLNLSLQEAWAKALIDYNNGQLAQCFGGERSSFSQAVFNIDCPSIKLNLIKTNGINFVTESGIEHAIELNFIENKKCINVKLSKESVDKGFNTRILAFMLGTLIKSCLIRRTPFIITAERTGVAIFRNELDFARTKALDFITAQGKLSNTAFNPFDFLDQLHADYPSPIKDNVEFARSIEAISKQKSWLVEKHPQLLKEFSRILGGSYKITKTNGVKFLPKTRINHLLKNDLDMTHSSGAARSLLMLSFYLFHIAKPFDFLIIDEPELNLHPANQRLMARLLAKLVNLGFKVFVTTHSDYFVRELNTLLMLKGEENYLKAIAKDNGYKDDELLTPEQIRLYTAKKTTKRYSLEKAKITSRYGIEAKTFDSTIDEMNKIQESILFGGDE